MHENRYEAETNGQSLSSWPKIILLSTEGSVNLYNKAIMDERNVPRFRWEAVKNTSAGDKMYYVKPKLDHGVLVRILLK